MQLRILKSLKFIGEITGLHEGLRAEFVKLSLNKCLLPLMLLQSMILEGVHGRLFLNDICTCRSHMSVRVESETGLYDFLIVRLLCWLHDTFDRFELNK